MASSDAPGTLAEDSSRQGWPGYDATRPGKNRARVHWQLYICYVFVVTTNDQNDPWGAVSLCSLLSIIKSKTNQLKTNQQEQVAVGSYMFTRPFAIRPP